jgi:transposase
MTMSDVSEKKLSEEQRHELETLSKTTRDSKLFRRIKVILYQDEGSSITAIRKHTGYSAGAQWWWRHRYARKGVPGLYDKPRSGRPCQPQKPKPKPRPKPIARLGEPRLSHWAHVTLEQMYAHHPKRYLRERAQMVLLRDKGYAVTAIADMLGVQVRTVRTILANYDQDKLAGLYRKPGSGRVSVLGPEQWEQVKGWVVKGPKALGYRFVKWTTRSLRKYLYKRFNIRFCREWIRQQLHQFVGYSWTRGKKVPASRHAPTWQAKRQAFCQQLLTLLHRALKGEIILLFEDESIVTLFGEVGYSWSPVGTTQEVPSAGKRGRVVIFGAAEPISGRTHYRLEDDPINQETTLRFLKQLVRYYTKHRPGIPLVVVLDKHSGHTAYAVAEYLVEQEQVSVLTTPSQSPDLNPQEHLWDWLDEQMINNEFFEHITDIKKAVRHFFSYIAGLKEDVISCLGNLQKLYSREAGIQAEI